MHYCGPAVAMVSSVSPPPPPSSSLFEIGSYWVALADLVPSILKPEAGALPQDRHQLARHAGKGEDYYSSTFVSILSLSS